MSIRYRKEKLNIVANKVMLQPPIWYHKRSGQKLTQTRDIVGKQKLMREH